MFPYADGGPTSTDNLGPLTRTHHRIKTFSGWQARHPFPGIVVWRDPYGAHYLVDQTGTRRVTGTTGAQSAVTADIAFSERVLNHLAGEYIAGESTATRGAAVKRQRLYSELRTIRSACFAVSAIVMLFAGCSTNSDGPPVAETSKSVIPDKGTASPSEPSEPPPACARRKTQLELQPGDFAVYFWCGPNLAPVTRHVDDRSPTTEDVVTEVLRRPSPAEAADGFSGGAPGLRFTVVQTEPAIIIDFQRPAHQVERLLAGFSFIAKAAERSLRSLYPGAEVEFQINGEPACEVDEEAMC